MRRRYNADDALRALEREIFAKGDYSKPLLDSYFATLSRAGRFTGGKDKKNKAFQVELLAKTPPELLPQFYLAYQIWAQRYRNRDLDIATAIAGGASREAVISALQRYNYRVPLVEFSPDHKKFFSTLAAGTQAFYANEDVDCVVVCQVDEDIYAYAVSKGILESEDDLIEQTITVGQRITEISPEAIEIVAENTEVSFRQLERIWQDPTEIQGALDVSLKLYSLLAYEENAINGSPGAHVLDNLHAFKRTFAIEIAFEKRGWL